MDRQTNKTCKVCGTENNADYSYCKNCGAPLFGTEENRTYGNPFAGSGGFAPSFTDYSEIEPQLLGVDTKKLEAYVGEKRHDSFMREFISSVRTGRKAFFNFVVALCGMLLGTVYSACWFFYRRMYRVGFAICAVVILLTALTTAVNYNEINTNAEKIYSQTASLSEKELYDYISNGTASESSSLRKATVRIANISKLLFISFLSVFASSIYLKSATNRIKKHDAQFGSGDKAQYSALGKPSTAPAILIPIFANILQSVIILLPYLSALAKSNPVQAVVIMFLS